MKIIALLQNDADAKKLADILRALGIEYEVEGE